MRIAAETSLDTGALASVEDTILSELEWTKTAGRGVFRLWRETGD